MSIRAHAPPRPRFGLDSRSLRRIGRTLLTVACAAAVLQGVLTFVVAPLTGTFSGEFEDFEAYFQGGRAVTAGSNPYASFDAGTVAMSGFDYPPFAAWLVRPITLLPHHWAATVWLWIALAALVGGATITARTLLPAAWPRTRLAVIGSLAFAPAVYNLWHGQMNSVIFLLVALALRDYVGGREVRCGMLIGLAAAIKASPVLLILLLVRRRWWRGTATALGTGGVSLLAGAWLLGISETRAWFTQVLPVLSRDNGWIYNQTWNGTINRILDHSVLTVQPPSLPARLITLALGVITLGVALWWASASERPADERGVEFGAMVAATLLVGTLAWYPHYVTLLIPLAAAAGLIATRGVGREVHLLVAVTASMLALAVIAPLVIAQLSMPVILSLRASWVWWPFLQATSLPTLTTAALLVALAASLRRIGGLRRIEGRST